MAIPYYDEACTACGKYAQLSSHVESEIIIGPVQLSTICNGKLGRSLGTRLLIQYSMRIRILLAYDHS